jgi:hypothetical protein
MGSRRSPTASKAPDRVRSTRTSTSSRATSRLATTHLRSHSRGVLVEVVDVERDPALGRRELPGADDVGVAARLNRQPASRSRRAVTRRHVCRAAHIHERVHERADCPPSISVGSRDRETGGRRTADRRDGVGSFGDCRPLAVGSVGDGWSDPPSLLVAFFASVVDAAMLRRPLQAWRQPNPSAVRHARNRLTQRSPDASMGALAPIEVRGTDRQRRTRPRRRGGSSARAARAPHSARVATTAWELPSSRPSSSRPVPEPS